MSQIIFPSIEGEFYSFSGNFDGVPAFPLFGNHMISDNVPTSVTPLVIPFDGELIHITAASDDLSTWTAEIWIDGSPVLGVDGSTLSVVNKAFEQSAELTVPVLKGQEIALVAVGTVSDARITAYFK